MLHDIVDAADPASPALVFGGTVRTFGELARDAARVSSWLAARVPPGGRVAVVGENHPAWVVCYYAVPRAGLVLTFVNHRLAVPEMAQVVRSAAATVLIGQRRYVEPLRELVEHAVTFDELDTVDGPPIAPADDPRAVAWLLYTSGTTGRPKGAMLTHANLHAALGVAAAGRPVAPDDVYAFPFPLCHVAGYNVVHLHAHRRPVLLLPRFDAAAFVADVARHRATTASLAPTMISSLVAHAEASGSLPRLRSVAYGSSPIPEPLLRRAVQLFGCDFAQGYGMTELAGNAVFLGPDEHRRGLAGEPHLLRAAGRPGPGVDVRIAADGEILVRAPQVTAGYWDDPAATSAAFADGWFRTGDVGRIDGDGVLFVVDRKKDVIVTGGENVASREVEDALAAHPAVADVAVVGVPDPHWGENVCAVVVARDGRHVDGAELVAFARERLAGFKKPKHVLVVDALPRNATGKVRKDALRAWAAARLGR